MMKRLLVSVLICALLLPAFPALAAEGLNSVAVTADGDSAYLLRNNCLWALDGELRQGQMLYAFEQQVVDIFSGGGQMYIAYRLEEGIAFARWSERGTETLFLVDRQDDVQDFCVSGNSLAVIWGYSEDYQYSGLFGVYSLSGKARDCSIPAASAVSPGGNGKFLVGVNEWEDSYLYEYDALSGNAEEIFAGNEQGVPGVDGVTMLNDDIYLLSSAGLYVIGEDGHAQSVKVAENGLSALTATDDAVICYAWFVEPGAPVIQFSYKPENVQEQQTLTIVHRGNTALMNARMREAIALLQEEYPHVNVVGRGRELSDEALNTILMAGGEGADIIVTYYRTDSAIIESGALMDLRESESLMQVLQPYEWLMNLHTTSDGRLYAVPQFVQADAIHAWEERKIYDDTGLDLMNCTWKEFMEAALRFDGDVNGDGATDLVFLEDDSPEFPVWLQQYVMMQGGPDQVNFDTPEFRELAELWKECVNADKVIGLGDEDFQWDDAIYSMHCMEQPFPFDTGHTPLPTINGTSVRLADAKGVSVNANSPMRDIALRLLEIYYSPEVAYEDEEVWDAWSLRSVDYLRADADRYADFSAFTDSMAERFAWQKEYFANLTPNEIPQAFRSSALADGSLLAYFAGEITLDEWIENTMKNYEYRTMG